MSKSSRGRRRARPCGCRARALRSKERLEKGGGSRRRRNAGEAGCLPRGSASAEFGNPGAAGPAHVHRRVQVLDSPGDRALRTEPGLRRMSTLMTRPWVSLMWVVVAAGRVTFIGRADNEDAGPRPAAPLLAVGGGKHVQGQPAAADQGWRCDQWRDDCPAHQFRHPRHRSRVEAEKTLPSGIARPSRLAITAEGGFGNTGRREAERGLRSRPNG